MKLLGIALSLLSELCNTMVGIETHGIARGWLIIDRFWSGRLVGFTVAVSYG